MPKGFYSDFKKENKYEDRVYESDRVLTKYPERKPIICERLNGTNGTPQIDKKKYLIPNEFTIGQLIYVIRERLKLKPNEAIFIFINGKIMSTSSTINDIYETNKENDGFLYIQYSKENTFGNQN
jgi:GABA(A) receptor-associated protein